MTDNKAKAFELAQKGVDLANRGEINSAIPFFKNSLSHFPNPNAYYLLALSYQKIHKEKSAEENYLEAIRLNPRFSMAYNNLGAIYLDQQRYTLAIEYFSKATSLDQDNSFAHNNLGNAYKSSGKNKKAVESYKEAIKQNPNLLEAHYNLGVIAEEDGKFDLAIRYLTKAWKINPQYPPCLFHLAVTYFKKDKLQKAVEHLEQYTELIKDDEKAYLLLANFNLTLKKYDLSLRYFKKTLKLNPSLPYAINDLGNLYKETGNLSKAKDCYLKTLSIDPKMSGTYNNLGVIYLEQGNQSEAIKQLNQALDLEPTMDSAHYHLGLIYERRHQLDLAEKHFESALEIQPNHGQALSILVYCLMQQCKWKKLSKQVAKLDELTQRELKEEKPISETPFLNVIRKNDQELNQQIAVNHSRQIVKNIGSHPDFSYALSDHPKKIRVGYLSSDFSDHATSHLILRLFSHHDRKNFEIFTYSYGTDDKSQYRKTIEKDSDTFRDIDNLSYRDSALLINSDKIDILVDLKAHTKNTRLEIAAHRPAPIQVSYLGFPGTSGADFFDYILTDKIVTPPDTQKFYTEKFAYLPDCYQINNNLREIADIKYQRTDFNLPEKAFVFSSFNHTYKIDPETFDSWMKILKLNEGSVLWLLKSNDLVEKNLKKEAGLKGIDPQRIVFSAYTSNPKHLARLKLADLSLDPFICNGHTTTSDSLWAGVPVLTLQGRHFASRVTSSILSAVGLPELITSTPTGYQKLAVELAFDKAKLQNIKNTLENNRLKKPLFDTKLFVNNLEKVYFKMWNNYLKGSQPNVISLDKH